MRGFRLNALDEKWYARLSELAAATTETYALLEPSAHKEAQLRQAFTESARSICPDLRATHLDADGLRATRAKWDELRADVLAEETNPAVRSAYEARISEVLAQIDLVLASKAGDMEAFDTQNAAIYGQPDRAVYLAACRWISERVGDGILDTAVGDTAELFPSSAVFQQVKQLHLGPGGYLEQLFGPSRPPSHGVTPEVGDPLCRQAIARLGSDFTLEAATNGLWSVQASRRAVLRPAGYSLDTKAFMAITGHEIGSHLAEYVNGGRSALRLLQYGLDRYEAGNEGRAFIREQIIYDSPEEYAELPSLVPDPHAPFTVLPSFEYRVCLHIAICLGLGYSGHRYTFAEIYEAVFEIYRRLNKLRHYPDSDELARKMAWHIAVRVCKGTDGRGGAYRKDIVYLEGNLRCWKVAQTQPERIMRGDLGKFDIANPRHIKLLQALKILET